MNSTQFALNARLEADTFSVCDLALCRVRLMNDSRFPWLILVPRRAAVTEVFELSPAERNQLMEECAHLAQKLKTLTGCDKINIATLGNSVSQLHVHIIARFKNDPAWPNPVWGYGNSQEIIPSSKNEFIANILKNIDIECVVPQ